MPRFTCNGYEPVNAAGPAEAAKLFADQAGKREYGKRVSVGPKARLHPLLGPTP